MKQGINCVAENDKVLYHLNGVGKEFNSPTGKNPVLQNVNLTIAKTDTIAIIGASGSGKSTLLHLLGTLDTPSYGQIFFNNTDLLKVSPDQKAKLRNKSIGFVFQFYHLLPEFTTLENVAMPGIINGLEKNKVLEIAEHALDLVGISKLKQQKVTTLSGGERQRVAIARAILLQPAILLADEPTGNLDEKTGASVAELLLSLNRGTGMSLVVVTHNPSLAKLMHRCYALKTGELYEQTV